ncbi:MAG: DUF1326 domain-containing protein [Saprospiraceae bacterium]|nr:DUF1326 domain-containing protein [Saprospiraceae bacterium]
MAYDLKGSLLEVCTCKVICPCWVGADPDNGACVGTMAWHFDSGEINGVDVAGLTIGMVSHIPGNVLKGNWRVVVYVDDRADDEQEHALLSVFTGKEGGPVADLVALVGKVVAVERAPIEFSVHKSTGTLRIGDIMSAEMEPFQGSTGAPSTLSDSAFSTIPGSPAYIGKAPSFKINNDALGMQVDLQNHSSVQGDFHFVS